MKTNQAFLMLVALICGVNSLQAATLSVTLTDPTIDGGDIALLPSGTTTENPNSNTTAVWYDRPYQGQTFTTGSDASGYILTSVSLLHNYGPSSFVWVNSGPWEIMVGTINGSGNFTAVASEMIPLSSPSGFTSSDGVPDWLTFTFDTPVALAANTTYAFLVGINFGVDPVSNTGAVFVKSTGDADYTGGSAISDASGVGGNFNNPIVPQVFDRVFHIDLYSGVALNPDPANNEENVPQDTILTWDNPTGYTAGKFVLNFVQVNETGEPNWLGASVIDPVLDLNLDGDSATTEVAVPIALAPYTNYYWRVDSHEPNGLGSIEHVGMVWKFKTSPVEPVIVTNPSNATAKNGTATLKIKVLNTSGTEAFLWKHNGVAVTANQVAEGTSVTSGDYTVNCTVPGESTLTIANVNVSDEGTVTCAVSNDVSDTTAESTEASLMSERLVGWWKLDGDLADSVATVVLGANTHPGSAIDPPTFIAAKQNNGLQITGTDPNQVVEIANSDDFNFYPQGYTVSAWVKTTMSNTWAIVVAKEHVSVENPNKGFLLAVSPDGEAVSILRESFNDLYSGVEVNDDTWHLITGTYDGSTGEGKVYVDGELTNQVTSPVIPTIHTDPLLFGAQLPDGTNAYVGVLDDIKVYSYPLSGEEIAEMYTSLNPGEWVCVGGIGSVDGDVSGPEGTPDCRVDLYDFAVFAQQWLDCARYPTSYCN